MELISSQVSLCWSHLTFLECQSKATESSASSDVAFLHRPSKIQVWMTSLLGYLQNHFHTDCKCEWHLSLAKIQSYSIVQIDVYQWEWHLSLAEHMCKSSFWLPSWSSLWLLQNCKAEWSPLSTQCFFSCIRFRREHENPTNSLSSQFPQSPVVHSHAYSLAHYPVSSMILMTMKKVSSWPA